MPKIRTATGIQKWLSVTIALKSERSSIEWSTGGFTGSDYPTIGRREGGRVEGVAPPRIAGPSLLAGACSLGLAAVAALAAAVAAALPTAALVLLTRHWPAFPLRISFRLGAPL